MQQYDAIIIGSGLGGLLTGLILAKEGRSVAIIEQNVQIGGCLQTFSFDKKLFDSCVHYIGALDEAQVQHKIFDYAGILQDLNFQRMDQNVFDAVVFADELEAYPLAQGDDNFVAQLAQYFPNDIHEIEDYIQHLNRIGDCFPLYKLRLGNADEKAQVSGITMQEGLSKIKNAKLRQVLTGNSLLYAGSKHTTPYYTHALVSKSYIDSAYKCEGGSSRIAKALWRRLIELGGVIFRREQVVAMHERNGQVVSVETESGQLYFGRQFISNVHPEQTMRWLNVPLIKPIYRRRLQQIENSISAFMVNVVLKPGTVANRNHNIYWNRSTDSLAAVDYRPEDWPANYALYFTRDASQPAYAESVAILSYMRYEDFQQFQVSQNRTANPGDRPEEYEILKRLKAELLLQCVAERFPEIKQQLQSYKVATPLTFRDYMGTKDGSMYGMLADVHQPDFTRVPIPTKIPNLFLTGQNVGLHGILGVSVSAIATAGYLLGLDYVLKKIHHNRT